MGCSNSRNHHDVESDCDDGSLSSATDPLSHDADRKRPPRRQSRRRSAGPRPRETRADTRREQYRAASAANTPQAAPLAAAVPPDRSSQRSAGRTSASRQSRASPSTASPLDPQLALLLAELDEIKAGSVGDLADEPSAGVRRATEADIVTRAFAEHGINTDVDQFAALHAQHRGRNQKARVTEWLVAVEVSNRGVTPQDPALAPPLSPPTSSPGQRTLRSEVVLAPLVNFPSSFAFSATPEQGSIVGNSTFMLHSSVFAMNQSELTLPGTVADTISQVSAMSDALPPAQKGHQQRSGGGGQRRAQPLAKPATFVHRLPIPSPSEREDHPDDDITATYR